MTSLPSFDHVELPVPLAERNVAGQFQLDAGGKLREYL